jgi:UDP-glucuronate 4-epimerase
LHKGNKILVTGCAGFIGYHTCLDLLLNGYHVIGVDDLNSYYDKKLKESRLKKIINHKNFKFHKQDISNLISLEKIFIDNKPTKVINLAAQAGVRHSLKNPHIYIDTNIKGFVNIIECCRNNNVEGLIYASSSSVYGGNLNLPFSECDRTDNPLSIYAATKKSNELIANSYNNLFGIHSTGLRFFTVYGPWGRPDMAIYIFSKKIIEGKSIPVFNNGEMWRDFTYIDDIVSGIRSSVENNYPLEIFNLGNSHTFKIIDLIKKLEVLLGREAKLDFLGMQMGDVKKTNADINRAVQMLNYAPKTDFDRGLSKFVLWFKKYYSL